MVKIYVKKALKYMAVFAGLVIFYIIFLMAGEMIPRRLITDNVMKSYFQLDKLGLYFEAVGGASWDNWTDAYFINSAATEYGGNLFQKSMANAHTEYEPDDGAKIDLIKCIQIAAEGGGNVAEYSRYWAGMKAVYKFMLVFMPIGGIRALVFGISSLLYAISAICVYKKLGAKGTMPYLAGITLASYIPQSMCLVFNTDIVMMLVMMIICCAMLDKNSSAESFYMLFFVSGSVLVFLNYWAFPLIMLGYPLVLVVTARLVENYDIKTLAKEAAFMSAGWGAGLAGTVLAKQVLCRAAFGTQSGTGQLLVRMGSEFAVSERAVAVVNSLVRRMESIPVLVMIAATAVWLAVMSKTGSFKRRHSCFLLVIIACYPAIWWFALPNHGIHGFVKHIYGVTYYAALSAVFLNCVGLRPDYAGMADNIRKHAAVNAAAALWIILSCVLLQMDIHYGEKESEPFSTELTGNINIGEYETVIQDLRFDDFQMDTAYLKSISTILVNLPDGKKDGMMQAAIYENGNMVCMSEVSISDIPAGEWFDIPAGCEVSGGKEYQAVYTVYDNEKSEPCMVMQSDSQAVRENGALYLDGVPVSGALANKYRYDDFILSKRAKISIIFIMLAVIEYGVFLYGGKKQKNEV